jgi:multidrug efflux pump subunit AcrB
MIYVYLTPEKERKRTAREILSALYPKVEEEAKKAGLKDFRFSFLRPGPPVGKPIAIRIQGEDLSLLKEVKEEVKKYLSQVPGVLNLADDFVLGKEEVVVRVDPVEVARSLLSEREVFSAIRMAYEGEPAVWIREGEDLIPVRVRIYASSGSISLLKDLTVTNGMGILVPLFPLLKIERSEGIKQIVHRDGIRTITITGDIDGKKTTSLRVNETILPYLREMEKKYRGIRFTLTGEFEETRESLISLRNAFVLAIGLVFLLLLIQFRSYIRPWIILFTVPFGYLGVAWALYFHREPLSFVAMIGGIGLAGVVVNNGILLLETIDLEKKKGFSSLLAHARGVSLRLRPVFLTSFTTIGGVLPLVYGIGGEDKFISPAALSLGYGLLFSTILTLLFLPSLHLIVEDIGTLFRRWFPFSLKDGTTPSGEDRKEVHLVGDTDS